MFRDLHLTVLQLLWWSAPAGVISTTGIFFSQFWKPRQAHGTCWHVLAGAGFLVWRQLLCCGESLLLPHLSKDINPTKSPSRMSPPPNILTLGVTASVYTFQSIPLSVRGLEMSSCHTPQAGLKLEILLSQSSKIWDFRTGILCLQINFVTLKGFDMPFDLSLCFEEAVGGAGRALKTSQFKNDLEHILVVSATGRWRQASLCYIARASQKEF